MSTKFTDDEWLLIFQQRTQSGLSVRKWCDSNQISYDKKPNWKAIDGSIWQYGLVNHLPDKSYSVSPISLCGFPTPSLIKLRL